MYQLVSFVSRGKVRTDILNELDSPMTPTDLSKKIKTHRPTVSRSLLAMEGKKLVECITPGEKMSRYYQRTALGTKILRLIKNESK